MSFTRQHIIRHRVMNKIALVVLLIFQISYADDYSSTLLERADKLYSENRKEEAKLLYIEAAGKGSPMQVLL